MPAGLPVTPLASNRAIPGDHYGRGSDGVNQVRRGIPTRPRGSRPSPRTARRRRVPSARGEAGPASGSASIREIARRDRTAARIREAAEFASGRLAREIARAGSEVRLDRSHVPVSGSGDDDGDQRRPGGTDCQAVGAMGPLRTSPAVPRVLVSVRVFLALGTGTATLRRHGRVCLATMHKDPSTIVCLSN